MGKQKLNAILAAAALVVATTFTGCGFLGIEKTLNEETGAAEWTLDVDKGQSNIAEAKTIASGTAATVSTFSPSAGEVISVICNGVLAILSGGLVVAGAIQRRKNDGLLETLKESAIAAANALDDEDLKKFIDEIKKIQTANGVRDYVRANLKDGENIAARL